MQPGIFRPEVLKSLPKRPNSHAKAAPEGAIIDPDNHLELYFSQMRATPLLTQEKEIKLAERIENGIQAKQKLAQNSADQNTSDLQSIIEDAQAAREDLSKANTRLVVSIAKRYQGRGLSLLDLIQEGNVGLMRAVDKFDHHQGNRFSTYATWWIRQAVSRAVSQKGRTIRMPIHATELLSKIYKTNNNLEQKLGRQPYDEEIAEELEKHPDKITAIKQAALEPQSIETKAGNDEDSELGDFIADDQAPNAFESAAHTQLEDRVDEVLAKLPPREREVLELRFGIGTGEPHTLEEIAKIFGRSRERIRQLETLGLRRLRSPGSKQLLQDFKE
jgi:RNA polymerase primary sigma factor